MAQARKVVTVFGGSGFLGRHLVQRLAHAGWTVRVAVRYPTDAAFLKPLGDVGQIVPMRCDINKEDEITLALRGADIAVNLIGILYEKGANTFQALHAEGAGRIARLAKALGVTSLVQVSAIGASKESTSVYARTKAEGEELVRQAFPEAVVIRPSLVFGPQDGFFNLFGAMARFSPALPLIGGGQTKFQPVYVGDVADAIVKAATDPAQAGKTFELGGPRSYSFQELLETLLKQIGRKRCLLAVPFGLASFQAFFTEKLPKPPLTRDQVELLKTDNVCSGNLPGLAELGITPTSVEVELPTYVDIYRRGGRFTAPSAA